MIDRLEYLIALSRARHFGRAAELCGITQPTLSAGLKQLEGELGVLLVARGSRFQGFTSEGERVLEWARRIVADARAMRQEVDALKHGLNGHLTLSVIPTALPMVAALTTPLRQKHPGITFSVFSQTSVNVLMQLDDLAIDAGISYLDNEPLGRVSTVELYQEDYMLVTAAGGRFDGRQSVRWAELEDVPLCLMTSDMQNRRIVDQVMQRAGVTVKPTLESNSMQVLLSHVRTGNWSSVMAGVVVATLADSEHVHAIPLVEPVVSHSVGLITPRRETNTPLVKALIGEATRYAEARKVAAPVQPGRPVSTKS